MEKLKYNISSRATILLGRESVSKADGAIIELIKNTYDADASICYLMFDIVADKIYLLDNGSGMSKDIIENCWMMIGTDNKQINFRSKKDRVKSGEKGIGRFALDRLGSTCKMYTKCEQEPLIYWFNDWSKFEEKGKTLDQVEADFEYLNKGFSDVVPDFMLKNLQGYCLKNDIDLDISTGTIFEISGLRDKWTETEINKIFDLMGYLIPPLNQQDYYIFFQKSHDEPITGIESEITQEYDYKVKAIVENDEISYTLYRNEFDLNLMPNDIFNMEEFNHFPYNKDVFECGEYSNKFKLSELVGSESEEFLKKISGIGKFEFDYIFMKLVGREEDKYYCKSVRPNRRIWLDANSGIKIYRDNFIVRPYGDKNSQNADWLGLDARKNVNPVAVSDKNRNWHVGNSQIFGIVRISRISNSNILDTASREGIIENEYFSAFKKLLLSIISIFEKDRTYIFSNIKKYQESKNPRAKCISDAKALAEEVLKGKKRKKSKNNVYKDHVKLAKAVKAYEEEREEMISEIKLLRALATNGLMTSSMVHDLKSINSLLVSRVNGLRYVIEEQDKDLIERNLNDLKINDEFLKSWISVITTQINKDRRKRRLKDINETIKEATMIIDPIINRKKVKINLKLDKVRADKKIFEIDFDSIIYNLIINSIEAFETKDGERIIELSSKIELSAQGDVYILSYNDNGKGLPSIYWSDPYKIFNFGISSKVDAEGNQIGTGMGMFIVSSIINEYNGNYKITEYKNGFGLDISIPLNKKEH